MRLVWWLLGAVVLAACGGSAIGDLAGGSVNDNDWTLEGLSPDGEHLLVSTLFGGVASGCSRFEGWEVEESPDAVDIRARLWEQRAPSGCTDEGVVELLQIDLAQPLGDRPLIGCGAEDCRAMSTESGYVPSGRVVATGAGVAVADESGVDIHRPTGEVVVEISEPTSGRMLAAGDQTVVRNDRRGAVIALDLSTGEESWRTTGWIEAATDEAVFVCRGQDADGLTAVDITTGNDLWTTDLVCSPMVAHGDLLTIIGYDRDVDGGHRLLVVDAATGSSIVDRAILDGVDDRVGGFDGAIAVGSATLTAGLQANLVVLAEDGTELVRQPRGLGHPMGAADGIAILGAHDRVIGYDVARAAERWRLDVDAYSAISVAEGSVWLLDRGAGTVSRLDPQTGEPLWTAPIGATSSFDVAAADGTAYILTTQALVAVDNASGQVRWVEHRPFAPAD